MRALLDARIACLGLLLLAAGCDRHPAASHGAPAGPPNPGATAQGGVLNVYNWATFIDPTVVADFEKETGIKVNYDTYETNEMMEVKLLSGHTNYDVVVPGGSFFEREVKAGVYQPLHPEWLPNLKNLDPGAVQAVAVLDPGNRHGVDYMWLIAVALGYDTAKIHVRLPNAPLDSWRLVFDPTVVARFKDCGVTLLDSPDDVVSAALAYLGKDLNSESLDDLHAVETLLLAIRPSIRNFDSSKYFSDLANGETCLVLGWSGDIAQSRLAARAAGRGGTIGFSIPKEGSLGIVDVLAIPADAPHPRNAHRFIDYLLRPDIAARNSTMISYASGVAASVALVNRDLRDEAAVYLPADARARLTPMRARSQEYTRALMRTWTRFKTGQ